MFHFHKLTILLTIYLIILLITGCKNSNKSTYFIIKINISSYIDSAKNALANITVTISEEARDNIKEGVQKGVQEAYVDERKKHIDELETYKKEFLVSFKRDLNDAALEVVDDVRKSYKGMFWRTLIIATAFMFITLTALIKIFGDAYAWLAIVGMLLVGVDFCVWVYRYLKMFGSK